MNIHWSFIKWHKLKGKVIANKKTRTISGFDLVFIDEQIRKQALVGRMQARGGPAPCRHSRG